MFYNAPLGVVGPVNDVEEDEGQRKQLSRPFVNAKIYFINHYFIDSF
jgi:hypothetical protein